MAKAQSFSTKWVVISVIIFATFEVLLGVGVMRLVAQSRPSHMFMLRLELAMMLASFLAGGFLIGVISPGIRLLEPAVGAAVTVVFTFLIACFSPILIYQASSSRILVGGGLGFLVALFGAHMGERLTGN